ncbi:hypothetical protein K0U00_32060, partial [Paenibacillus sepulcri]|nr:hypothetical protein [Paenibacillus sepulcri]
MIKEKRLVDEFMELVRIDSETGNERQICDVLTAKFKALGLSVEEDDTAQKTGHGAGNLIARLEGRGADGAQTIFFTSHMDTVTPGIGIKPQID